MRRLHSTPFLLLLSWTGFSIFQSSCAMRRPPAREVVVEVKRGDIERGKRFTPPVRGRIISRYGERGRKMHRGLDIKAPYGSEILASAGGVVKFSGRMRGYGKVVIIDHGDGFETRYAHNSVNLVKEGERVGTGDRIALIGRTGRATTHHLHFEILYRGENLDPEKYIY